MLFVVEMKQRWLFYVVSIFSGDTLKEKSTPLLFFLSAQFCSKDKRCKHPEDAMNTCIMSHNMIRTMRLDIIRGSEVAQTIETVVATVSVTSITAGNSSKKHERKMLEHIEQVLQLYLGWNIKSIQFLGLAKKSLLSFFSHTSKKIEVELEVN